MAYGYTGGNWYPGMPLPGATPNMPWGDIYAPRPPQTQTGGTRPLTELEKWGWEPGMNPDWFRHGRNTTGAAPTAPAPWEGDIGWGAIPWGTYAETPWANVPEKRGAEAMQWFNTMMPWMQAQMQGEQWGTEFDWRKASDIWSQAFQEEQFGFTQEQDIWGRGFQESQLGQQRELELARQQSEAQAQREAASMAAWGRFRPGTTRWM